MTLLLADPHPIIRLGLRAALSTLNSQLPNFQLLEQEAADGRQALHLVRQHRPALLITAIDMAGLHGLELTARIAKEFPQTRVLLFTRHQHEDYYWPALRAGAAGYLLKTEPIAEIQKALHAIARGQRALSPAIARRLRHQPLSLLRSPFSLSSRQREILQLLAESHTTKAIALALKLSPKTVEYHRAKLMEKLNLHDLPALTLFAHRHKLIE